MTDEHLPGAAAPADIIGDDELAPVAGLPPIWTPVIGAVVRITTPSETGSGFFIAPDRVITNHHVVPTPELLARGGVRSGFFGRSQGVRVTVEPDDDFRTSEALDYTVFTVEPVPGVIPLFLPTPARRGSASRCACSATGAARRWSTRPPTAP